MKGWGVWAFLALVYGLALGAGFVAPYDPIAQDRERSYLPPNRPMFLDEAGHFSLRPFVYRRQIDPATGGYVSDQLRRYPLRFGTRTPDASGTPRWRLFGVDAPAHVSLLGTDRFGRDVFSRLLHGGRVSLFAGLLAGLLAVGLGLAVGATAGYFGGWVDELLMRLAELFLALPWLYLLLAVRAFLPLDLSPAAAFLMLVALIGLIGWAAPARLIRGVALSVRERDYVKAARGFGASDFYLLWRHVLPATLGVAVTQLALLVPRYVLAEVTLSFLGLGVAPPAPSWGNMLADLQSTHVLLSYGWMTAPAVALVVVVLGFHGLATALHRR